ncbi:hypothetical protein ABIC65_001045 [Sphingomonas trueperi]
MTANIIRIRNVEHEARCVEAIRQRRLRESSFRVVEQSERKAA